MDEGDRWRERLEQAARDLEELDQQLAEGEIPPGAGRRLRATYRAEMEEARRRLAEPAPPGAGHADPGEQGREAGFWTTGRAVTIAIMGAAAAALVISAGWFAGAEPRPGAEDFDPSQYSNETMEAVIAANADHPQINGMRLALAARYFGAGDFSGAFPHYREVLERDPTPGEEAEALSHLGWMAWAGSGEIQLAIDTLDRALEASPAHPQALYFKAIVLWCGARRPAEAVPLLEEVARTLGDQEAVSSDLAAARAGEECR